jgi:hypothetical protein
MVYERVVWVRKGKRWAWDQSKNATRLSGENDQVRERLRRRAAQVAALVFCLLRKR